MNNKTNNNVNNEKKNVFNPNFSAKAILEKFAENTAGVLKTSLGTKKASIYKEEIFVGCTDKEKKSLRRKFRNQMFSLCDSLVTTKDHKTKEQLIKAFNDFYLGAYQINDYSLSSICQENLNENKKKVLKQALEFVKNSTNFAGS